MNKLEQFKTISLEDITTFGLAETLENAIDKFCLSEVIGHLVDICDEKATHLRSTWQDDNSAKQWDIASVKLGKVMDSINV
jgi:hypothetical protein